MEKINDIISFDEGVELNLQNDAFKAWFSENCQSKITFCDGKNGTTQTCATFDEFGRPNSWTFENLTVKAVYFPIVGNQDFNFDKFVCYGNI
jgi:hypothetical protein